MRTSFLDSDAKNGEGYKYVCTSTNAERREHKFVCKIGLSELVKVQMYIKTKSKNDKLIL